MNLLIQSVRIAGVVYLILANMAYTLMFLFLAGVFSLATLGVVK